MQVDFSSNYFELFELPVSFEVQGEQLQERYRSLQRHLHPDRFAAASDAERRWSMQASSLINEAYQALSEPLKRAVYLLTLNGISVDEETDTRMSGSFLMEQMELREALADAPEAADPYAALDVVRQRIRSLLQGITKQFADAAQAGNWSDARENVRQWQFIDKLLKEVGVLESRLDDAL